MEKLVERVERKNQDRLLEVEADRQRELDQQLAQQKWWESAETIVRRELTTPPRRPKTEPIVIKEELSYHVIADDLPFERISEVISNSTLFPGTDFEVRTRRDYPQGAVAAHFIGTRRVSDMEAGEDVEKIGRAHV